VEVGKEEQVGQSEGQSEEVEEALEVLTVRT